MSLFKKSLLSMLAVTTITATANANENFKPYVGLDLGGYQTDGLNDDYEYVTLGGRAGVDIYNNFGVEGRFGFGVHGDNDTVLGTSVDVDIDHYLAAFGKIQTNSYNGFRAYGLAGISYVELEASAAGITSSGDDTDFAWGLGASYAFNNNWGANLEYISLNQDADAQGINLGITYHF